MKRLILFFLLLTSIMSVGCEEEKLELAPHGKPASNSDQGVCAEVGTGWSTKGVPEQAAAEAVRMALEGKVDKTPDFAIVFVTAGSDTSIIISKTRELLGGQTKIYGGSSSSRAVMSDKGILKVGDREYNPQAMEGEKGLAIMTISSDKIIFGVGCADFSAYTSIQEASRTAMINAIKSAGKSPEVLPDLVLMTPTRLFEEEVIEGFEKIVGKNTVILGGTAGGPPRAVFDQSGVCEEGVSLAVIYTDLTVGWTFEGGFDMLDMHSGIVTKADAQTMYEIDNRPALDVYDEWLGGEISRLYKEFKTERVVRDLLTLRPLYRKYRAPDGRNFTLFSHPWPKDPELKERFVMTSTKVKVGERVYMGYGTWETLLNRIGNLPKNAKIKGNIGISVKPVFGVGYVCNGILGAIPETEREKLPILVNYANNGAPFIAPFTSGEQGHFPGVGNKHGNLLTSFIVICEVR